MTDPELKAENEELRHKLGATLTDLLLMRKSLGALAEMVQLRIELLQKKGNEGRRA